MHRRLGAVSHGFRYGLVMYRLDLDELDALDRGLRWFGVERARPVGFYRGDHLPDARACLRAHGVTGEVARIELVTNCRVFGYVFNPVSFFLCYDPNEVLVAVVCEVHNTFGEAHVYVVPAASGAAAWPEKKVFHVSPFFTLDGTYQFRFTVSPQHFEARIDLHRDGTPCFVSRLSLDRRPLTDAGIAWALVRYPFVTAKVMAAIHWEALRLWWKGATYHEKPAYEPESARRATES